MVPWEWYKAWVVNSHHSPSLWQFCTTPSHVLGGSSLLAWKYNESVFINVTYSVGHWQPKGGTGNQKVTLIIKKSSLLIFRLHEWGTGGTNSIRGTDTQLGDDGDVDREMGNVMPCEWFIWKERLSLCISDVAFIVFHGVVRQRHLLR
jgi:hypothetical protein